MKTLYTLIFVILLSPAFGQVEVLTDEIPNYQGIVDAPGKNVDEIYSALKEWIVRYYDAPQNVIYMDDPVVGKIILKGGLSYSYMQKSIAIPSEATYTFMLEIRPERFKYTVEINSATSGLMETLYSIVLADEPYDPNTKNPYQGKQLERALLAKKGHVENITAFKERLVSGITESVEQAQASDDW